jgi:hypothetical protein
MGSPPPPISGIFICRVRRLSDDSFEVEGEK